ncbi:hypothetical protein EV424DRAFT_1352403 [Suillus variegatus]|nr:hypothetical protein EV424DRAFT_1352403 [Suillus variegatus]
MTEGDGRLPPIENGPELEGGRGKRQRFQSKCAAAANNIGQNQASRKGKSARHFWDVTLLILCPLEGEKFKELTNYKGSFPTQNPQGPNQKEGLMGDKKQGTRSRELIQPTAGFQYGLSYDHHGTNSGR